MTTFVIPTTQLQQWQFSGGVLQFTDSYLGTGVIGAEFRFTSSVAPTLNSFMVK